MTYEKLFKVGPTHLLFAPYVLIAAIYNSPQSNASPNACAPCIQGGYRQPLKEGIKTGSLEEGAAGKEALGLIPP